MKNTPKMFKSLYGDLSLPVFFPDATRAVLKTLDSVDLKETKTLGILVNTYHLYQNLAIKGIEAHGGIREFMNFEGAVISDSGGFQVMSLAKKGAGKITDEGVTFTDSGKKILLTPEISIEIQMKLKTDMVVVLDEFTESDASREKAEETVERTLSWAKRSKDAFEKECKERNFSNSDKERPYLLAVAQGGTYLDLRKECTKKLVEMGFDGMGYGGWPIQEDGSFNFEVAKVIRENTPEDYLLYGLGVGKPEDIVGCVDLGFTIFDCVLPTRDARHKRLYVYNANSIEEVDVRKKDFYAYYVPGKEKDYEDTSKISNACDCLLCTNYTKGYLTHLFKIGDSSAFRLATIHNLRFYSLLMENLRIN